METAVINRTSYDPNLTDEELESWRFVQDDEADYLAFMIIRSPHWHDVYLGLSKVRYNNDLANIEIFRHDDDTDTDEDHQVLVKTLNAYFNDVSELTFIQQHKDTIRKGCAFFCRHANDGIFILAVRSLLKQYAAFKATNVLVNTKLLVRFPHRRILETFQFVIDVMDMHGFEPHGKAIRSLQKLRLVHALIRARFMREKNDPNYVDETINKDGKGVWDDRWGLPINQQDMIFALHTFSIEIIDGLKAQGQKLTDTEIENYYLTWHYYGKALGIKDALNPKTYKEGKALQERIYKRQFVIDNPNAKVLAEPLIGFMKELLPLNKDRHIYAIIKLYNDPKDYKPVFEDILKLPMNKAAWHFIYMMKYADKLWEWVIKVYLKLSGKHSKESFDKMLEMKNFSVLQKLKNFESNWSGGSFEISDGFGDDSAEADEKIEQQEPTAFSRVLHKVFPRFFKLKRAG